MNIISATLDPLHIWFYFILLQVVFIIMNKNYYLPSELLIPYEIVLISTAFLFMLDFIPGVIFFTVICTVASLESSLFLIIYVEAKIFKPF